MTASTQTPEVFSVREVARAAQVALADVEALFESGRLVPRWGRFLSTAEAVRAVRMLRSTEVGSEPRELFSPAAVRRDSSGRALAASGALHAILFGVLLLLTTLGLSSAPAELRREPSPMRLVFLTLPGPGGGGGGGGLHQPAPPPKAELKGPSVRRSPVPPPRPVSTRPPVPRPITAPPPIPVRPTVRPVEPPPPAAAPVPLPQVVAPVATAPAEPRDRAGIIADAAKESDSRGPGSGSGAGSGQGTGIGEGTGAGIGPGSGGGTGGGPYRAGSGISAPTLVREVKPDYTEEARRRGVEGDVVLEIVVRADGSVGEVKVLHGLGSGLDQRAIESVRQWRFSPARRFGTPVDVLVEVAVEFKLR
jgi:protein TonB